jgi:hypothetical protein
MSDMSNRRYAMSAPYASYQDDPYGLISPSNVQSLADKSPMNTAVRAARGHLVTSFPF